MSLRTTLRTVGRKLTSPGNRAPLDESYRQPPIDADHQLAGLTDHYRAASSRGWLPVVIAVVLVGIGIGVTAVVVHQNSAAAPVYVWTAGAWKQHPTRLIVGVSTPLTALRWSHWGASTAFGHGTFLADNCQPTCASGTVTSRPAKITLTGIKTCRGLQVYGRNVLRVEGAPPTRIPNLLPPGC
jgi:hypothetical protein